MLVISSGDVLCRWLPDWLAEAHTNLNFGGPRGKAVSLFTDTFIFLHGVLLCSAFHVLRQISPRLIVVFVDILNGIALDAGFQWFTAAL